ncbi:hypothetical protein [Actinomadura macrotermitis]|uniref:Uncharacterized protein n=1 Tax=Actinomadura macrotermitis TaxID=2585200 RepID=A0A7K0BNG6_9ACTN|nr:hypothetical protein [Actinomadura macrotermitis]MQY02728.1 hypothetical protein [Actinomadura macrotermitis]
MSGDLGTAGPGEPAGRPRAGERPSFLPPEETPPERPAAPPPEPPLSWGAAVWPVLTIVAAGVLLVSAFLPWAHRTIALGLFGEQAERTVTMAGIEAGGTVLVVPVLAVSAIVLAAWALLGRDPRITVLAVVPGALVLPVCGLFLLRLERLRGDLPVPGGVMGVRAEVTLGYGWYLTVAAALLTVGFALAQPVAARIQRPSPAGPATAGPPTTGPYPAGPYPAGEPDQS